MAPTCQRCVPLEQPTALDLINVGFLAKGTSLALSRCYSLFERGQTLIRKRFLGGRIGIINPARRETSHAMRNIGEMHDYQPSISEKLQHAAA